MKIINYLKLILTEVRRLRKELSSFVGCDEVAYRNAEDLSQIEEMHERIKLIQAELEYNRSDKNLVRRIINER